MPATDVQYRFFALDSDHSIAAAPLTLTIVGIAGTVTATSVAAPPAAAGLAVPTGLTRYWWRVLMGPAQTLVPVDGTNVVAGTLTDTPEVLHLSWTIQV